jgi:hypothetical protein
MVWQMLFKGCVRMSLTENAKLISINGKGNSSSYVTRKGTVTIGLFNAVVRQTIKNLSFSIFLLDHFQHGSIL